MIKHVLPLLALLFTMFFASCNSYSTPPMQRDYADAVTNINQVDPYYRPYFRSQNASNYSLSDQRKAYVAAMQTARTPVRASDYRPKAETRLAKRSSRKASRGRSVASRGKAAKGKKRVASRGKGKASKGKATAKRRATASRKSNRSRRRG